MFNYKSRKFIVGAFVTIIALQIVGVFLLTPPQKAQAFSPDVVAVNSAKWIWEKVKQAYTAAKELVMGEAMNNAMMSFTTNFGAGLAKTLVSGNNGGKPMQLVDSIKSMAQSAAADAGAEFVSTLAYGQRGTCMDMPKKFAQKPCYTDDDCRVKVTVSERLQALCAKKANEIGRELRIDPDTGDIGWAPIVGPMPITGDIALPAECNSLPANPTAIVDYTEGSCSGGAAGLNQWAGFNLCAPKIINQQREYTLFWIKANSPAAAPKCSWKTIQKNWTAFAKNATSEEILNAYSISFKIEEMPISTLASMGMVMDSNKQYAAAELTSLMDAAADFKPLLGLISKKKLVPATTARNQQQMLDQIGQVDQQAKANAAASRSQSWLSNLVNSFSVSFMSEVSKKMRDAIAGYFNTGSTSLTGDSIARGIGPRDAEDIFSEFLTVRIKSGAEMDLVQEFSTCPQNSQYAAVNNCVIDQSLAQAIRQQLTIRQALDKGYLHGDWYVADPDSADGPGDYLNTYSLTNIKKMRAARVMPLGLEIAASKIYNREIPGVTKVTLNEIINNYNADSTNPWRHLVDPEWIIDAPDARCYAQTYNVIPQINATTRQEGCAALQFCLALDDKDNCQAWGFCTKEDVNLRFKGTPCPDYYTSCRTYTRQGDSAKFNYLKDSLYTGSCDESNYGCSRYSAEASRPAPVDGATSPLAWDPAGASIYLNHNAKECAATEAGCSRFLRLRDSDGYLLGHVPAAGDPSALEAAITSAAESSSGSSDFYYSNFKVEDLYLKKAPDYLNCYDADLTNDDPDCSKYATACSSDEVGCNRYTPTNGDPWVPAVTAPADFCPSECSGYESFYRAPLWWDTTAGGTWSGGFDNLIPSTAKRCSAQAVGCEEYTNLDAVAAGGEGLEYYSQARVCQKTSNALCSPYYTWEGDDRVGYQLRSYNLIADDSGQPCTQLGGSDGGDTSTRSCSGANSCTRGTCSASGAACNTDAICGTDGGTCVINAASECYEFFDASGRAYYAPKLQTITCNDDCHTYRKNNLNSCPGGVGSDCLVTILSSEARQCTAPNAGCREYRGNAAGNTKNIFNDDFSAGTLGYWDSTDIIRGGISYAGNDPQISQTSLYVGGNSVKAVYRNSGGASVTAMLERDLSGQIQNSKSYILTFLAKADSAGGRLAVQFKGHSSAADVFTQNQPITNDWQVYEVGPVYTDNWGAGVRAIQLINDRADHENSNFYLDNIILKEIPSSQYLIKNSWETPASCDTNFNVLADTSDDVYSPGFMTGCRAYNNNDGIKVYLKSFTSLCSSDKAGCKALVDTQNSYVVGSRYYNTHGYCAGGERADLTCNPASGDADCPGSTCVLEPEDAYDNISVPADSVIYLVDDPALRCSSGNRGCTLLGQTDAEGNYSSIAVLNDPDRYLSSADALIPDTILCNVKQLGCQKFSTSDSGSAYFVDPTTDGRTCEYLTKVSYNGSIVNGWFKTGTTDPCGGDYLRVPDWALLDSGAATCDSASDKCTAFEDPTSPRVCVGGASAGTSCSADPTVCGDGYCQAKQRITYIKDQAFTKNSCNGLVSRNSGCWLYSDLSQTGADGSVSQIWNAALTYTQSAAAGNNPVSPQSSDAGNDSNIILQQTLTGRGCAEWLECRSWEYQWDQNISQYKKICTQLGRCNKLGADNNSCAPDGWVNSTATDLACTEATATADCGDRLQTGLACVNNICTPENMSSAAYASRDVLYNYFGAEYSGYSLYGIYPLDLLQEKQYGDSYYLTHIQTGTTNDFGLTNETCATDNDCQTARTGFICQKNNLTDASGYCVADKSCRGFPEADSPFSKDSAYTGVNKCETPGPGSSAIGDDCQCSYKKAQYAGETKYYNYNQDTPVGICTSGQSQFIGQACAQPSDCCGGYGGYDSEKRLCVGTEETPMCSYKTREDTLYGWPGVCLELDPSKNDTGACLTWFPTDRLPSDRDIYNTHPEAGYFATAGKQWYCLVDDTTGDFKLTETYLGGMEGDYYKSLAASDGSKTFEMDLSSLNMYQREIEKIEVQIYANDGTDEGVDGSGYSDWVKILQATPDLTARGDPDALRESGTKNPVAAFLGAYMGTILLGPLGTYLGGIIGFGITEITGFISNIGADDPGTEYFIEGFWYGCVIDGGKYNQSGNESEQRDCFCEGDPKCKNLDGLDKGCQTGASCTRVRAMFDSIGRLKSIKMAFVDNNDGWGAEGHGRLREIRIYRRVCPQVARVNGTDFNTIAYTNKLWSQGNDYHTGTALGSAACAPYGAIGSDDVSKGVELNQIPASDIYNNTAQNICSVGATNSVYQKSTISTTRLSDELPYLSDIFARVFEIKTFNPDTNTYKPAAESALYDQRRLASATAAPQIQAYTNGAKPEDIDIGRFAINNTTSGTPSLSAGVATINFYAWANENHMPVRGVQVDWGDGSNYSGSMDLLARNYKPQCEKICAASEKAAGTDHIGQQCKISPARPSCSCLSDNDCDGYYNKCFPRTFGDTSEACEEKYWQFNHVYQCTNPAGCTFVPQVRVKDNWGWYTGPAATAYGGDDTNFTGGWINFDGTVFVPPTF